MTEHNSTDDKRYDTTDDKRYTLSRRKVLGGLGAIGLASAGTGLGTSAYFNDTESFANNSLAAGELDLLVDWEEHYSDGSSDERTIGTNAWMPDSPDVPAGAVPVPTAEAPMLYVTQEHLSAFMDATAIEAFPDTADGGTADDGLQDAIPTDGECAYIREYLREDGEWISALDSGARTDGTVHGQTTAPGDHLVQISDVKPGDFGEVTFSLHLCDNPGYIWVNGSPGDNLENGVVEPEGDDPDEDHAGETAGELGDEILAMLWYDTGGNGTYDGADAEPEEGDNVQQAGERIVLQGPLNTVLGVLADYDPGILLDANTSTGDVGVPPATGSGETISGNAEELPELVCTRVDGNPNCADAGLLRAIKLEDDQLAVGSYVTPAGTVTVDDIDVDAGTITLSTDFPVSAVITKGGPVATVCEADADEDDTPLEDGDAVTLDGVTFTTPINRRNDSPYGVSHVSVCYEPAPPSERPPTDGTECFPNSTTAYVGFAWWLPTHVGNAVQTDSVSFDLGFYTEQCRHNDTPIPE